MERIRRHGLRVVIRDGDFLYYALIDKGGVGSEDWGIGYTLNGYIRKEKVREGYSCPHYKKEEEDTIFTDDEAFEVVERLIEKGFVTEGAEFGGQFRVLFDDDLNLRFDKKYDRPGRPYPKNSEEFRMRLKREF